MPLIAILLAVAASTVAARAPPPSCDTLEHHQFDFWVGRWDVYRPDTKQLVAHSLIEKLYGGCAVRENWMPLQGTGGGSLNSYRPDEKKWRQVWTDSVNNLNDYSGGLDKGMMVLTGRSLSASGTATAVRMTYEAQPDGSVVQTGYGSADDGKTWQLNYQFVYRARRQR